MKKEDEEAIGFLKQSPPTFFMVAGFIRHFAVKMGWF
jgi:hypothetical protein